MEFLSWLTLRASLISLPPPSCGSLASSAVDFSYQQKYPSPYFLHSTCLAFSLTKIKKKKIGTIVCTLTKCEPLSIPTSFSVQGYPTAVSLPHICSAGALMLALHHTSSAYQFNLILSNTIWSRSSFKPSKIIPAHLTLLIFLSTYNHLSQSLLPFEAHFQSHLIASFLLPKCSPLDSILLHWKLLIFH